MSAKFSNPSHTADGQIRAIVTPAMMETLWFNTGTLCNLTCVNCYIESSPSNDALVYLTAAEVESYLDELSILSPDAREIGFTGGEPFMNPDLIAMMDDSLSRGYRVLLLTNAMRPMMKQADAFAALKERFGGQLEVRVSVDHYRADLHETERGVRSWKPTMIGLKWLSDQGFNLSIAGRTCWEEAESSLRTGFAKLFRELLIDVDCLKPDSLVLFPEMDDEADVPEITTDCWSILNVSPNDMMCASSRMVIKRKGMDHPVVAACTLLPYDKKFELGQSLAAAWQPVALNHPHCARFCVLGGGACSVTES